MSPDPQEETPLPKFRAVLPPELEGLSDEPFVPHEWDEATLHELELLQEAAGE